MKKEIEIYIELLEQGRDYYKSAEKEAFEAMTKEELVEWAMQIMEANAEMVDTFINVIKDKIIESILIPGGDLEKKEDNGEH